MDNKIFPYENIAKIFFVMVIAATVFNGSAFWLKRVGWLEPELYKTYFEKFHTDDKNYHRTPKENEDLRIFTSKMYKQEGFQLLLKLLKDTVVFLFLVASVIFMLKDRDVWSNSRFFIGGIFLFTIACAFINSLCTFGILLPLAGLRSYFFLFIAVLGIWAVSDESLSFLAKGLSSLLVVELLLSPVEILQGLHLFGVNFFGTSFGDRVVGTMLMPSSLGIFSVISLNFYYVFSDTRRGMSFLFIIVCLIVFLTASATALIILIISLFMMVFSRIEKKNKKYFVIAGVVSILLLLIFLPQITGRERIYDSLSGRIIPFKEHLKLLNKWELVLGKGLGAGTNAAVNLFFDWNIDKAAGFEKSVVFISDSTPLSLIMQTGIFGLILFYSLLFYASFKDKKSMVIFFIIVLASLTINVMELFPVNFMLGLLLARSIGVGEERHS